jgi:hypothetical protein
MMAVINFRDAVELAKKKIVGWQSIPAIGLDAYRTGERGETFDFTDPATYRDRNLADLGATMLSKTPAELWAWASESPDGFDALRMGIASKLAHPTGEPLSSMERDWLVKYLRGKAIRPNGRAGALPKDGINIVVWATIKHLVNEGMVATRNDASRPAESACDAVAEALKELGMTPMSFERVKRIWLDTRKCEGQAIPPT